MAASAQTPSAPMDFQGAELLKHGHISKLTPIKDAPDALEAVSQPAVKGAFYQQDLQWKASEIKQVECSLKADAPGYFIFAANVANGDKRESLKLTPSAAIPDGEYHDYIFELPENSVLQGILTNYEISWNGGEIAHLGWKAVRAQTIRNRIPNATGLVAGKPVLVTRLMPRAKCRLAWEGEVSPGATLRFYDRDMKEIACTVVQLPPGQKEVEFTTPEYMIEAYLELAAKGKGLPVIQQLHYTPPSAPGNLFWRGSWVWMQNAPGPIDRSI